MTTDCQHEEAKTWNWGDLPRHVAQGWNWCEECGALVKVEKVQAVQVKEVLLPRRLRSQPAPKPRGEE